MSGHLQIVEPDSSELAGARRVQVVLAEPHTGLRRSLKALLDTEREVEVVAETGDLDGAVRAVARYHPDVLVLDLALAYGSINERIDALREQVPGTQIVVITMHSNRALAEVVFGAGATGFVLTDSADSELGRAVCDAARRQRYRSPRLDRLDSDSSLVHGTLGEKTGSRSLA